MKINKNSTPEELAAYARLYTQMIRWSDEDNRFIGSLPEICGECCDGTTREEVARQLEDIALDLVTDKAKGEDFGTIPEPGILAVIAKPAGALWAQSNRIRRHAGRIVRNCGFMGNGETPPACCK